MSHWRKEEMSQWRCQSLLFPSYCVNVKSGEPETHCGLNRDVLRHMSSFLDSKSLRACVVATRRAFTELQEILEQRLPREIRVLIMLPKTFKTDELNEYFRMLVDNLLSHLVAYALMVRPPV